MTTLDPRDIGSVPVRVWRRQGEPVQQPGHIAYLDRREIDSTVRYSRSDAQPYNLEFAMGSIRQSANILPSLILHHSCELVQMWPNSLPILHLRKLVIVRPYQGLID